MSGATFLDTNILVYAYTESDPRTDTARKLLLDGGVVGIQVLNEFVSVARAKLSMRWAEVQEAVGNILVLCPNPRSLNIETHIRALELCGKYRLSIWDGLIVATAIEARCSTLYSEDLQHGQLIDGLRIENPFLPIP